MSTDVAVTPIPPELLSLTPKQRAFVLEYMKIRNGTQAAKAAGYRGKADALAVRASELVRNSKVSAAIAALTRPAVEKAAVTVETVVAELATIGFAPEEKFEYYDKYGNLRFAFGDKTQALKLLGDHVGAFKNAGDFSEEAPRLQIVKQMTEDEARSYLLALLQKK